MSSWGHPLGQRHLRGGLTHCRADPWVPFPFMPWLRGSSPAAPLPLPLGRSDFQPDSPTSFLPVPIVPPPPPPSPYIQIALHVVSAWRGSSGSPACAPPSLVTLGGRREAIAICLFGRPAASSVGDWLLPGRRERLCSQPAVAPQQWLLSPSFKCVKHIVRKLMLIPRGVTRGLLGE